MHCTVHAVCQCFLLLEGRLETLSRCVKPFVGANHADKVANMMQMQLTGGAPVAVCQPAGVVRRSQRTPFTQQRRLQTLQHRRRSQIIVRAQGVQYAVAQSLDDLLDAWAAASAHCQKQIDPQPGLICASKRKFHWSTHIFYSAILSATQRTPGPTAEGAEEAESDDEFDQRLAAIRKNKTAPGGQRKAKTPYEQLQENKRAGASKKNVDWGKEEVYFESAPHRGDLAVNVALGATLLWLPLTIAAIGRGVFVKYRFSDKRISVTTSAPWKSEHSRFGEAELTTDGGRK